MRFLTSLLRAVAFIILLAFAVKNDGLVTVKAFFDTSWQVPLLVVMLGMFALGLAAGLITMLFASQSLRRENHRLRKFLPQSSPLTRVSVSADDTTD